MLSKRKQFPLNRATTESKKKPSIYKGLFYAMLSGRCSSLGSAIVKQMKNVHPGQLALYRFIALFVMSMPKAVKTTQDPLGPRKLRYLIILRGIFGGLQIFLNFIAFRYVGLGEANVIAFSSPVFVTIFARLFYKEPCNILQTISVILTVIGIVFIAKLPSRLAEVQVVYSTEQIFGLLAAIFSLLCLSSLQMITRRVRSVHFSILVLHYSWVGGLVSAILTAIIGNLQWHQCGIQNIYILLLAFLGYFGVTLLVMAFQCEYAGSVSTMFSASNIGLAFLMQIFICHDVPDIYGIIGAILVFVSIILISSGKCLISTEGNFVSC